MGICTPIPHPLPYAFDASSGSLKLLQHLARRLDGEIDEVSRCLNALAIRDEFGVDVDVDTSDLETAVEAVRVTVERIAGQIEGMRK